MRTLALLSLMLSATAGGASAQDSYGNQPSRPPAQTAPSDERQDFGVAPKAELHAGAMHGPTPSSIPGGQVITTQGLVALLANQQVRPILLDVLGGPEIIPGALAATPAAQPGTFSDETQRGFGDFLKQQTQGNMETPLVLYCLSNQCWMSYNASLRAINMGYKNVLWYRGGIEAWKAAGQQVQKRQ